MIGLGSLLWLMTSTADDIARAHELVGRLACEEALPLGEQIAASPLADEAEAREGLMIAGYCLAAVGRVGDAEEHFRAAVNQDVRVEPGFAMERRVRFLLEAARADTVQERTRAAARRRAALAEQVTLVVVPPRPIVGGERASFLVRVEGPAAAQVRSVKLNFRRPTDPEFYSLPTRRGGDGMWRGEIGGVYTGSTKAYQLQWFVTASDDAGELTAFGSRDAPLACAVAAGSNVAQDLRARERLPPITRLLFAGVGAPMAVGVAGLATVGLAFGLDLFNPLGVEEGDKRLGIIALMAVPVSMVATEYATTLFLLDGPPALLPAIAVGAVAIWSELAILAALLNGASLAGLLRGVNDRGQFTGAAYATGVLWVLATGTAAVVPFAMVAWDAGHEAE